MFRSSGALKVALQRAAITLTAISLSSAFVVPLDYSKRNVESLKFHPWKRLKFDAPRVHCQEAAWEVEESDSYYYEKMPLPARSSELSHVIFGQLLRKGSIQKYDVYKRINNTGPESPELIVADIHLGDELDGHPGIVHGGILALLFDDAMGMAFGAMGINMAYTANLNVDYRAPVPANSRLLIRVRLSKRDGRKLYFSAQLTNFDGTVMYSEATTLYIIPRQ